MFCPVKQYILILFSLLLRLVNFRQKIGPHLIELLKEHHRQKHSKLHELLNNDMRKLFTIIISSSPKSGDHHVGRIIFANKSDPVLLKINFDPIITWNYVLFILLNYRSNSPAGYYNGSMQILPPNRFYSIARIVVNHCGTIALAAAIDSEQRSSRCFWLPICE